MRLIEYFSSSPRPANEHTDLVTLRRRWCGPLTGVAILDGDATTLDDFHDGHSAAWWAAHLAGEVFFYLPETATLADYCAAVQKRYAEFQQYAGRAFPLYASLVAVVKRGSGCEGWRIGETRLGYIPPGTQVLRQKGLLPREGNLLGTMMRSAIINDLLKVMPNDHGPAACKGRQGIQGILSGQLKWANTTNAASNGFAFDALCAERPVQASALRVKLFTPGTRVVMGSDGFLSLKPTIADMRQELLDMRDADPHMIEEADASIAGFFDEHGNLHDCFDGTSAVIVDV